MKYMDYLRDQLFNLEVGVKMDWKLEKIDHWVQVCALDYWPGFKRGI
jgi:hypothetical protein